MDFDQKINAFSSKKPVMANLSFGPTPVKPGRRRRAQVAYRVGNWPAYNEGLKQRGDLTVWFPTDVVDVWYYQGPPKRERNTPFPFSCNKAYYFSE